MIPWNDLYAALGFLTLSALLIGAILFCVYWMMRSGFHLEPDFLRTWWTRRRLEHRLAKATADDDAAVAENTERLLQQLRDDGCLCHHQRCKYPSNCDEYGHYH